MRAGTPHPRTSPCFGTHPIGRERRLCFFDNRIRRSLCRAGNGSSTTSLATFASRAGARAAGGGWANSRLVITAGNEAGFEQHVSYIPLSPIHIIRWCENVGVPQVAERGCGRGSSDLMGRTQLPVGNPRRCRASEHGNTEPNHPSASRGGSCPATF